jgi:NodT family efflux transporter outer membrane factor (OMF) lipoprotein
MNKKEWFLSGSRYLLLRALNNIAHMIYFYVPPSVFPAKAGIHVAARSDARFVVFLPLLRRSHRPPPSRGRRWKDGNVSTKKMCCLYFAPLPLLLLCGCNVGPEYVRPKIEVPTRYKEASPQAWKIATPQDTFEHKQWWQIFNDPDLNLLEEQATANNQTIAVAQAQYQQALAIVDKTKAGFFPTLSGSVGDAKSRSQSLAPIGGTATSGKPFNTASLGIQSTWEVDLWGNVRQLVEADEAAAQASEAQASAVRLSIQATLAQTYFQLRALDEAQVLLDESVIAYEKFLKITKNQYKAGTASQLALLQADTQLQAIKVAAVDNGVARAQYEHAIAVLTNHPPAHFSIAQKTQHLAPPQIPLEVPSLLLERRPDIANAERLMAEANAQIGVATSAFFPQLTLTGSRLYQNKSFTHLLSAPSILWSLGAQLTETIVDGGARTAAIESADAAYHATVATYRLTVLSAFQEVEDNLSTLRILETEQTAQTDAVRAAQKQLTYTINQYKSGTVLSLDVLNALFNIYLARRNTISISSRQMTATVNLIKALGGGIQSNPIFP